MKCAFVARLGLAAALAATLGSLAAAQDAPRPRDDDAAVQFLRPRTRAPLQRLLRTQEPPRLGVSIEETSEGVLVVEVAEGSLAAAAGVQKGDLLLSLGGKRLAEAGDIRSVLVEAEPGSTLELGVVREGQGVLKLSVALAAAAPTREPKARADGHQGGFLGLELGDSHEEGEGVAIAGVVESSAAWYAGLEKGDLLRSIDGKALASAEDVVGCVSSKAPGTLVALHWTRNGEGHSTQVRLGHRNEPMDLLRFVDPGAYGRMPRGVVPEMRFFHGPRDDDSGGVWTGDQGSFFDGEGFGADLHESLKGWIENLQKRSGTNLDLDLDDAKSLQIRIEDGKMTIHKDGETKVFDLSDPHAVEELSALGLPHRMLRLENGAGSAPRLFLHGRVRGESGAECPAPCAPCPSSGDSKPAPAPIDAL